MQSLAELSFAALRMAVAAILIWGALGKLAGGGDRIAALAGAWQEAGVPQAHLLVTASLGLQLLLALLLLVGLFTRLAGLANGANFALGAAVSGIFTGANWWPIALLVVLLLHFGVRGAGRLSLDALRPRRAAAAAGDGSLEDLLAAMNITPREGDGNDPG
jgi:uncharacterized membrane protein YphA (DoxX/SURF4 family)